MPELEATLRLAGFGQISLKTKEQSGEFISTWMPGSKAEDYVVSCDIFAVKPLGVSAGVPSTSSASLLAGLRSAVGR